MMKSQRHLAILDLIERQEVETQEAMADALREMGIQVTQATVSRDIKELKLIKSRSASGRYRYALPSGSSRSIGDRLHRMLQESMLSVSSSESLVVIKTLSGSANVAAEALDGLGWAEVLGTLAGDNTILLVARSASEAPEVVRRLRELMR